MTQAIQVAREFAALARQDDDRQFTAMKLQKLLYYAQAWSLHRRGRPLFTEKIKAWRMGPVVPQVYKKFEGAFSLDLAAPSPVEPSRLSEDDRELVFGVWQMFKGYSGDELSDLTHQYAAFKRARDRAGALHPSPEIDRRDMKAELRESLRQETELQHAFAQGLQRSESPSDLERPCL